MIGKHIFAVDGLRGCAVLAVLLFHSSMDLGGWVGLGFVGVTLFFVLSGFLITRILLDTRQTHHYFRTFYCRRVLRIFPIYYLTLIVLFLILPRFAAQAPLPPAHDRVYYWLYLSNWTSFLQQANNTEFTGHFWSLAVEEQFYLVWPLIVYIATDKQLSRIAAAGTLFSFATSSWLAHHGISGDSLARNTICNLPGLMIGALCALLLRTPKGVTFAARYAKFFLPLAIVLFEVFARFLSAGPGSPAAVASGLALTLAFGSLLLASIAAPAFAALLSVPPLRAVGRYSYGMYLYHIPLFHFFRYSAIPAGPLRAACQIGAVILLAALSFEIFEKRVNALKQKWFPSNTASFERYRAKGAFESSASVKA